MRHGPRTAPIGPRNGQPEMVSAAEAAIIAYTMPVWATVLAWPVLGERPTPARIGGLVLGLSGVTLLMAGTLADRGFDALWAKLPAWPPSWAPR